MEEIVLNAQHRDVIGKQVKALRRAGLLPAVIYGRGMDPQAIILNYREAVRILPGITSSALLTVSVAGEPHTTLVRQKQHHPVTGALLHVDFQRISMTEKIKVTVGIEFIGESPAVKNFNGVLVTGQENLEVQCLPADLPERIVVDLSTLTDIGNSVHVRDLAIPPNVEVLTPDHEMVVLVTAPAVEPEVVEAPVEVEAVAEPEVIEKGKKEEEEFE